MIITLAGDHGAGKSTYAAHLATQIGLRHVSAGSLFRKLAEEKGLSLEQLGQRALKDPSIDHLIDERTMKEAEKGNVVVDGQLAGWVLKEKADLRIFLMAPDGIRIERIANRDGVSVAEARRQTFAREKLQIERYRIHYGLDVQDRSIYQLVLDTSIGPIGSIQKILLAAADAAIARSHEKRVDSSHSRPPRK